MNNPIFISIGCLHKIADDRNQRIKLIKKHSISCKGLEINFQNLENLVDFELTKDNLEYLRTLELNSIHAPAQGIYYNNNKETKDILNKLSELYKQINARTIVFHKNEVKDFNIIANYDFTASIENDDWRKPNNTFEDIKKILDKHNDLKLCFDIAHAVSTNSDISKYLDYFKEKLSQVHISTINENGDHDLMYIHDNEEMRRLIKSLNNVSVPFVIESVIHNSNDPTLLEKEIEYIKSI